MPSRNSSEPENTAILSLELLSSEDPSALVQVTSELFEHLYPEESSESLKKNLQFLTFDLKNFLDCDSEQQRLNALNHFFFSEKRFTLLRSITPSPLQCFPVYGLKSRQGTAICLSLIYSYFAHLLDLPVYPVEFGSRCLHKWVQSEGSIFLDFDQFCKPVREDEIVDWLQSCRRTLPTPELSAKESKPLEIKTQRQIFQIWLRELILSVRTAGDFYRLRTLLSVQLQGEPNNIQVLGQRALLNQRLGFEQDALDDYKRYFAFVEADHAPTELVEGFEQLLALPKVHRLKPLDFLH